MRSTSGDFLRIVEQKDTTPEEAAIREINTGCYAFDGRLLFQALTQIRPNNSQGEYYLTDVPAILKAAVHRVIAAPKLTIEEAMGSTRPNSLRTSSPFYEDVRLQSNPNRQRGRTLPTP